MPYIIAKKDGKRFGGTFVLTKTEVNRLKSDGHCYVIVNTTTRRASKIGSTCRSGRANLGAMPSWWPFKAKKKQLDRDPRRMAQTIMFVPGAKGMSSRGELVTMRGARRKRRRR